MGQIKVTTCQIEGLFIIEPTVHSDERGHFFEAYNSNDMKEAGIDRHFVQINQNLSYKGALRGLHFQKEYPQCKLARVLRGNVFDVVVDLREKSNTFGQWYGIELSEENKRQILIPEGFAHGMLTLSDTAVFCYQCTDFYHPGDEGGIAWNDPRIGVKWPGVYGSYCGSASPEGYKIDGKPLLVSEKDRGWPGLQDAFQFR